MKSHRQHTVREIEEALFHGGLELRDYFLVGGLPMYLQAGGKFDGMPMATVIEVDELAAACKEYLRSNGTQEYNSISEAKAARKSPSDVMRDRERNFSKFLKLYETELCSAREAANWLIDAAISDKKFDSGYVSLLKGLPQPILNEITALLCNLKAKDFHWEPGRVGSTLPVDSPERRTRLKGIATALEPSGE